MFQGLLLFYAISSFLPYLSLSTFLSLFSNKLVFLFLLALAFWGWRAFWPSQPFLVKTILVTFWWMKIIIFWGFVVALYYWLRKKLCCWMERLEESPPPRVGGGGCYDGLVKLHCFVICLLVLFNKSELLINNAHYRPSHSPDSLVYHKQHNQQNLLCTLQELRSTLKKRIWYSYEFA